MLIQLSHIFSKIYLFASRRLLSTNHKDKIILHIAFWAFFLFFLRIVFKAHCVDESLANTILDASVLSVEVAKESPVLNKFGKYSEPAIFCISVAGALLVPMPYTAALLCLVESGQYIYIYGTIWLFYPQVASATVAENVEAPAQCIEKTTEVLDIISGSEMSLMEGFNYAAMYISISTGVFISFLGASYLITNWPYILSSTATYNHAYTVKIAGIWCHYLGYVFLLCQFINYLHSYFYGSGW